MTEEIIIAGFGGQGVLSMGKILAYSGIMQEQEVSWMPSYGPEMRGGTAYCTVVISDRRIGSPIIKNPAHLVAMNRPSLDKFAKDVKPGGVIMINSSLIPTRSERDDITELIVPANDAAIKAGSVKAANIVALSAFAAKSKIVDLDVLKACIKEEFAAKAKIIPLNMEAFDAGVEIANNS